MSPDTGVVPFEEYQPPSWECFNILVAAEIGPDDGPGSDTFHLVACSPRWLTEQTRPKGFEFIQGVLLLDFWDAAIVRRAIDDVCLRTSGGSWSEIAISLSRFFQWEFADYRE